RADEATVLVQRIEIERDISHGCRQDAARRAAGQIAIESVAVQHAAAVFVDQLLDGDAGRRQMHARLLHATGDGEGTQAFATVATVPGKPLGPLLLDLAYPEKGLHVVLERR